MENYRVKDLMVPISEYATVLVGTTLTDALRALEKARKAFTESTYQHRAIIVLDNDGKVVGKISQMRALKAIMPDYEYDSKLEDLKKFHFSDPYIHRMREHYRIQGGILKKEALLKAASMKVEQFMQAPTPGEYVSENSSLDTAIQQLVNGTHLGLLVTRGEQIVGILRISDVFAAVSQNIISLES